jgi:hypothetical protein
MPMTIRFWDETTPGRHSSQDATLQLEAEVVTVRELPRARVRQEVEHYNQSLPETFQGLVQPEESEQILNGFRVKARRPLDAETQFRQACSSFLKNGFLILVDDEQVTELDTPVILSRDTAVRFIKLVPLVGG